MPGEELPPVVATFDANASDFDEVVDHIEERLEVLASIDAEPTVGLDDEGFDAKLDDILSRFGALNDLSATAEAYLNGDEFNTRYDEIMRLMATLEAMYADPTVDLDDAAFERKFEYIEGKMALLERSINANMDLSIDEFETEYALIEGQIAALEAQSPITIQVIAQEEGLGAITAANEAWMAAQKTQSLFSLSQLPADLAAVSGGGGGGGGGGLGLAAALGIGRHRIPFTGLGIPLAGFGTLGSMAGFGGESALLTAASIGGSAIHAGLGGLALGGASLAVGGVGLATDYAGAGQALGDTRNYTQLQDAIAKANAVYGPGSVEAKAAQYNYQQFAQDLSPQTISALSGTSAAQAQTHALFDKVTGPAETTGANILTQGLGVADKALPTIGKYAGENTNILQAGLQPFFTWLQGPGIGVLNTLEQAFQEHLPTAIHATTQAIELISRTFAHLAPDTGGFITFLDNLFTRLNGSGFEKFEGEVDHSVSVFRTWEGLLKAVAGAIDEIFKHDAGTGTSIVSSLTQMIDKFNKWAAGPEGGDKLHAFMEAHKQEILEIMGLITPLVSAFGGIELYVDPPLREMVGLMAQMADILLSTPIIGQILAMAAAYEILSSKMKFLPSVLPLLKSLVTDGLVALGGALTNLSGGEGILGSIGSALSGLGQDTQLSTTDSLLTSINANISAMGPNMEKSAAQMDAALATTDGELATTDAEAAAVKVTGGTPPPVPGGVIKTAEGDIAGTAGKDVVGAGEGLAVEGGEVAGGSALIAGVAAAAVPVLTVAATAAAAAIVVHSIMGEKNTPIGKTPTQPLSSASGTAIAAGLTPSAAAGNADWAKIWAGMGQNNGAAEQAANIKQLGAASGLSAPQVQQLATALNINLKGALAPGSVQTFMNAVKTAGGATKESADLTRAASFEVVAGLQAMATKAQQAMPNVSGAARNMITAASPALVTLVADMKKSGDQSGAGWVAAYLAHLPPAELASKNLHDKAKSPLIPLEKELDEIGDKSAGALVKKFIDQKAPASGASTDLASAIKNPLYDLQTKLGATGDQAGAAIVNEFLKHNPSAATQAGLMHDAVTGKLKPLIKDLQGIGDTSSAALVSSIQTNAAKGNWDAVGKSIDSGIANGITSHASLVTSAASALANQASGATAHALKSTSPSKVFHEIGRTIPEGFVNGINEMGHLAATAASNMAGGTISAASGGGGSSSSGGLNLGGVHLYGDPSGIDADAAGKAVADAVRVTQLRKAKYQGPNGGVLGGLAGTR